jgi:hypothetical protein
LVLDVIGEVSAKKSYLGKLWPTDDLLLQLVERLSELVEVLLHGVHAGFHGTNDVKVSFAKFAVIFMKLAVSFAEETICLRSGAGGTIDRPLYLVAVSSRLYLGSSMTVRSMQANSNELSRSSHKQPQRTQS